MQILVVGTGYVGLVTGACFAEMGHHVICLDIDAEKIHSLENGRIPIYEPGLEELVLRNSAAGRLSFTTDYKTAVSQTTICFLAVPTPSREDGSCDIHYVIDAALSVAKEMDGYRLLVVKSTVPVGTSKKIREAIDKTYPNKEYDIASNPEFLKEGCAISDCLKPDRIVIGVNTYHATELMRELYSPFTLNHDRMLFMDPASAELTKYAANAMLATRISFMNELALLAERVGANMNQVRIGIGSDSRIGYQFLYPGIGYGGSCFPKDLRALQAMAREHQCSSLLLDAVETINEHQKKVLAQKIVTYFSSRGGLANKTIAIWGLSFKPNTDDMREAPSLSLIEELLKDEGLHLQLFDPIAMPAAKKILKSHPRISWCNDEYEAASGSDAIALLTEWRQFRFADLDRLLSTMRGKAFFDGRNQYKPSEMALKGLDYFGIGIC